MSKRQRREDEEERRIALGGRKGLGSIPLAGVVLIVLSLGPATAAAASPHPGEYECYSYVGQGYVSGYFTVQGAGSYQWKRQKTLSIIRVPNSGAGKFKVKGEKLNFVSGPFANKKPKKGKKAKPKYRGSFDEVPFGDDPGTIAQWMLEFNPVVAKPKPGHAQPAELSYIDCVQNNEATEPEPEP